MPNLSLWHDSALQSSLKAVRVSSASNLVTINSKYSMISTGTETVVASGRVPNKLAHKMAVPYMQGSFELPIKYGYSLVGESLRGDLVHILHPHQQQAYVSEDSVFILPSTADPRRMTLVSNMETVINARWDAQHLLDSEQNVSIAICGFGNIGALLALSLQKQFGAHIHIIEADAWRREQAQALDFEVYGPEQNSMNYQLIFHTTCSESGLKWCFEHSAYEGTVIELSWYVDKAVNIPLGEHFHYNRLKYLSSQVSNIPLHKPYETYQSRKRLAVELLSDDIYDRLFAEDIALADAPYFFEQLRVRQQGNGLIWCIKYP